MKTFHITPECFEPIPKGVIVPKRREVYGGTMYPEVTVTFESMDETDLMKEESLLGKTYKYKEKNGLELVFSVTEDCRNDKKEWDFKASGYVEGYIAKEGNLNMLIKCENPTFYLTYEAREEDEKEFHDYPLWQEYFTWKEKVEAVSYHQMIELLDQFIA